MKWLIDWLTPGTWTTLLATLSSYCSHQEKPRPKTSKEYQLWQRRFLAKRLHVTIWLAILLTIVFSGLILKLYNPALNTLGATLGEEKLTVSHAEALAQFWAMILTLSGLLLCLVVLKFSQTKWHLDLLLLLLPWCNLLLPQIPLLLKGQIDLDLPRHLIVYGIQAVFIPMKWYLHALSQLCTGSYYLLGFTLDLQAPDADPRYRVVDFASYIIAVCLLLTASCIISVGVYWYERSLKHEFELRQQLRVFLHAVSHDLQNPVQGMLLLLESFRAESGEDAAIPQSLLTQMINGGERQIQLLNSLLEAYQLETQGISLHFQPVLLHALVSSVVAEMTLFLNQRQAIVIQSIASDLSVQVDRLQLQRVYENLISNALKYNRPALHITLDAQLIEIAQRQLFFSKPPPRRYLRCTVRDNGAGMTSQQCNRAFDLYTHNPHSRQALSLGLGLYICRQIIEAHQGEIGIISQIDSGTTVWFTLPLD
jgi:signal transduction histidine kinase